LPAISSRKVSDFFFCVESGHPVITLTEID